MTNPRCMHCGNIIAVRIYNPDAPIMKSTLLEIYKQVLLVLIDPAKANAAVYQQVQYPYL